MKKILSKIKSILFAEREIICISRSGIRSKKIGFIFLAWNVLLVLWTSFVTVKYFELRENVVSKENLITELNTNKQKLLSNVLILEKSVSKIEEFILKLNKYDRLSAINRTTLYKNNYGYNIDDYDHSIELVLDRTKDNVQNINLALHNEARALENINKNLNVKLVSYEPKYLDSSYSIDQDTLKDIFYEEEDQNLENNINNKNEKNIKSDSIIFKKLDQDIVNMMALKKDLDENLNNLEILEESINNVPFSKPMEYRKVSSEFGTRIDPFLKIKREHHGVDLAGPLGANIYSTAPGKVIFAGEKRGYGKVVVVEHSNKIKTVYAHLDSISEEIKSCPKKNKKGQDKSCEVKRDTIIGKQGNTGRSTGPHLHYEVIVNNKRYNPVDFITLGEIFQYDKNIKN